MSRTCTQIEIIICLSVHIHYSISVQHSFLAISWTASLTPLTNVAWKNKITRPPCWPHPEALTEGPHPSNGPFQEYSGLTVHLKARERPQYEVYSQPLVYSKGAQSNQCDMEKVNMTCDMEKVENLYVCCSIQVIKKTFELKSGRQMPYVIRTAFTNE